MFCRPFEFIDIDCIKMEREEYDGTSADVDDPLAVGSVEIDMDIPKASDFSSEVRNPLAVDGVEIKMEEAKTSDTSAGAKDPLTVDIEEFKIEEAETSEEEDTLAVGSVKLKMEVDVIPGASTPQTEESEHGNFYLVKMLEVDEFHVCRRSDLEVTPLQSVYSTTYQGRSCRALTVLTGDDREVLEGYIGDLKKYEEIMASLNKVSRVSVGVQVCCETDVAEIHIDNFTDETIISDLDEPPLEIKQQEETIEEEPLPLDDSSNSCKDQERKIRKKKKHFCKYCKSLIGNFSRHVLHVHRNENDVKKYFTLTGKKKRMAHIKRIMAEGDNLYNLDNPESPIVLRSPGDRNPRKRVPCPNCTALISTLNVVRHFKNCGNLDKIVKASKVRQMSSQLLTVRREEMSQVFKTTIWPFLREGSIKDFISSDKMLIAYSNQLCKKYIAVEQNKLIRQIIRIIGRVVLKMIENDVVTEETKAIKQSQDIFSSKKYHLFIDSIVKSGKSGEGEQSGHISPAVVNQYAAQIRKFSDFVLGECSAEKSRDEKFMKEIKKWQKLYDTGFNIEARVQSHRQMEKRTGEI